MANMYCPYCEENHEIKIKVKNVISEYQGRKIKHKTTFYQCERKPQGNGIFWSGKMAKRNAQYFEEALMQKGLKKCNYP